MTKKRTTPPPPPPCQHKTLMFTPSPYAQTIAGCHWEQKGDYPPGTFPAPLILPGDDLAIEALEGDGYDGQSIEEWRVEERECRDVSEKKSENRKTIYVVPPPNVDKEMGFVTGWRGEGMDSDSDFRYSEVVDYLKVFYWGMDVQLLDVGLNFESWDSESKGKARSESPRYIALRTGTESIRIRVRRSPSPPTPSSYPRQLNLDDLLDVAISILPSDAYALVMIVNHDLYESKDDDFVCGRAYGGSRVAVVSTARYDPRLDGVGEEDEHTWPECHCADFLVGECEREDGSHGRKKKKKQKKVEPLVTPEGPLLAALDASRSCQTSSTSLWKSRILRTTSHELGHCFGIDHCTSYACVMQGSASLREDMRQPPYLCPIDLAKVLEVSGAKEKERYEKILSWCVQEEKKVSGAGKMVRSYGVWVREHLKELR